MILPKDTQFALDCLSNKGFEAFVVGGCVRDYFLGIEPYDWDICTNALPEDIIECFSDFKLIKNGMKHGTVGVVMNSGVTEITTYRIDGKYSDNRHPLRVEFSPSVKSDLQRRDFTVNALAYNPDIGLIDCFGGIDDIKNKIIRCVGIADERFQEDSLRILRALRFSSKLGFSIEKETATAIHNNRKLLKNISVERIRAELEGIINGAAATEIFDEYTDVFGVFIPEIHGKVFCFDQENSDLRRAYLFSHFENSREIMSRLKYPKIEISNVEKIKKCLLSDFDFTSYEIKKQLRKYGLENLINAIKLKAPDNIEKIFALVNEASAQCYKTEHLDINGNDLMNLGFYGSDIKAVLEKLLDYVISGKVENKREELIAVCKNL